MPLHPQEEGVRRQLGRLDDPVGGVGGHEEARSVALDGLVLIGGDDVDPSLYGAAPHPELGPVDRARDDFEVALVRAVAASRLPAFGICRGLQVMNVALGGTLHQHLPATVPGALVHGGKMDETHAVAVPVSYTHLTLPTSDLV